LVIPSRGLDPRVHVFSCGCQTEDVGGRIKSGQGDVESIQLNSTKL
jgi:hypothetical protein